MNLCSQWSEFPHQTPLGAALVCCRGDQVGQVYLSGVVYV